MLDLALIMLPNPGLQDPKMYYNLGVLYLAAVAEERGFKVEVIDMRAGDKPVPQARFIGFSATTPEITKAKEIVKQNRRATSILGGAHATLDIEDCLDDFDIIVKGEGENILPQILGGERDRVWEAMRIIDLDNIPLPAWHKIDDPFSDTLFPGWRFGKGEKAATIITSRGCPYNCAFCANYMRAPVVYRSVDNVESEIHTLVKQNIHHYRFEDDCFTLNPNFDVMCKMLMEYYPIKYKCHTRSNLLTEEKVELMKLSGCEECGLGVESADDVVLLTNNKRESVEDHIKAVKILKSAGIRVKTYFVSALPGETDETLKLNMEFLRETKPDKWTLAAFIPFPGCDISKNPDKYGVKILHKDWTRWWNFSGQLFEEFYAHEFIDTPVEVLRERHKRLYQFLIEGSWKDA